MDLSIKEGITLGIALLGAVLGVLNLWRAFDRDRIRLKVIPQSYIHTNGFAGLCVEVVNLSYIPVTLKQIGFRVQHQEKFIQSIEYQMSDAARLPHRLEPRAACVVYYPPGVEDAELFRHVTSAYSKTACGRIFTGTSPALGGYVKKAKHK
jgi:hypothetical protein